MMPDHGQRYQDWQRTPLLVTENERDFAPITRVVAPAGAVTSTSSASDGLTPRAG